MLYCEPPTYLNLKTFDCLCFASTLENNHSKLEPRSRKSVFIGYKTGIKGYVLLDVTSREIFISRNVIFYENIFPYNLTNHHNKNNDSLIHDDANLLFDLNSCTGSTMADSGNIVHIQNSYNTLEIAHNVDFVLEIQNCLTI